MKSYAWMLTTALVACSTAWACPAAAVAERVEVAPGNFSLADLLTPDSCPQLRQSAAHIGLGLTPRPGIVRVIEGDQVRAWMERMQLWEEQAGEINLRIPDRIEVRLASENKSCSEIAQLLGGQFRDASVSQPGSADSADAWPAQTHDTPLPPTLDCAGAQNIPRPATLELLSSKWNPALRRWEFALRCRRAEDCVPFLVWGVAKSPPDEGSNSFRSIVSTLASNDHAERLIKPGQTAMLTWNQGGIRVVLPVTSLDAGAAGQFVRVRLKNNERILSAEVVGAGNVRLSF